MKILQALNRREKDDYGVFIPEQANLSENGLAVSEDEYWAKYYNHLDFNYEWKNGYLEEKPMADVQSSMMYRWFLSIL